MKVTELLDYLEEADGEAEVVFVSQPDRHPLLYHFSRKVEFETSSSGKEYVLLTEGRQIGYYGDGEGLP